MCPFVKLSVNRPVKLIRMAGLAGRAGLPWPAAPASYFISPLSRFAFHLYAGWPRGATAAALRCCDSIALGSAACLLPALLLVLLDVASLHATKAYLLRALSSSSLFGMSYDGF